MIIGIDLGTTNSLVGYWTEEGSKLIPNSLGKYLTPSVVSVGDNGEIWVGQIAKERYITEPERTAALFKRHMGTGKTYALGGISFTPEELSSFILRALKEDAEAHFGFPVTEAIISVPAYFSDAQRKATKRAGELAGLKVERLINEPTAAAIAYGLHQKSDETKYMIFDLGGGTFDVSILDFFDNILEVKSVAGDNFLGGEDFTNLLYEDFMRANEIDAASLGRKEIAALTKQAELCKLELCRIKQGRMQLTIGDKQHNYSITHEEFENLAQTLLNRIRLPIERALHDAELSPKELDAVVLVGGASRMPLIFSFVTKLFGRFPANHLHPDETICMGAAIQGALKERSAALEDVVLTDVCPYTLGTSVAKRTNRGYEGGYFMPIIERNSTIPISRVERVYTITDNQTSLSIEILQGESRRSENNIELGVLHIDVPPAPAGEQAVDIRYTYDINGILEVDVTTVNTGMKKNAVIVGTDRTLTEEELKQALQKMQADKIHPRDKQENRWLLEKGDRLYQESIGERRAIIAEALATFDSVLNRQDEREIKAVAENLLNLLNSLEGSLDW